MNKEIQRHLYVLHQQLDSLTDDLYNVQQSINEVKDTIQEENIVLPEIYKVSSSYESIFAKINEIHELATMTIDILEQKDQDDDEYNDNDDNEDHEPLLDRSVKKNLSKSSVQKQVRKLYEGERERYYRSGSVYYEEDDYVPEDDLDDNDGY